MSNLQFKIGEANYRILPDPYCWILQKEQVAKKEGKENTWKNIRFADIHNLAKWLVDQGCKEAIPLQNSAGDYKRASQDVAKALISRLEASTSDDR